MATWNAQTGPTPAQIDEAVIERCYFLGGHWNFNRRQLSNFVYRIRTLLDGSAVPDLFEGLFVDLIRSKCKMRLLWEAQLGVPVAEDGDVMLQFKDYMSRLPDPPAATPCPSAHIRQARISSGIPTSAIPAGSRGAGVVARNQQLGINTPLCTAGITPSTSRIPGPLMSTRYSTADDLLNQNAQLNVLNTATSAAPIRGIPCPCTPAGSRPPVPSTSSGVNISQSSTSRIPTTSMSTRYATADDLLNQNEPLSEFDTAICE